MESVSCTPCGLWATTLAAFTKSFLRVGTTGVPMQSK